MRLPLWIRALLRPRAVEAEMDEEMRDHLERLVEQNRQRGMDPDAARRAARLAFGGVERFKEETRASHGTARFENLVRDLRFAFRGLRRDPLFTLVVVLTLGLGIGATTAIFSVVNGVLLQRLPYADADRLVMLWETDRRSGTTREAASVPDFYDFRAQQRVFTGIAAFATTQAGLRTTTGDPAVLRAAAVSANLFELLGVTPLAGRAISEAEDQPGGPRVAVVSERMWRTRFAGDTATVGATITVDDVPHTVVGIAPAALEFPAADVDLWLPLQLAATSTPRSLHNVTLIARLAPGVRRSAAQDAMAAIASSLEAQYGENTDRGVHVEPLRDVIVGDVRLALRVLLAAVALVLLVACANAASLLLARAAARGQERAVRTALGATTGRLRQQGFAEALLLALGAAVLGLGLAAAGVQALLALAPAELPRLNHVAIDPVVLAVTLTIAVGVAAAFSVLPGLTGLPATLAAALMTASRTTSGDRRHRRMRRALVVGEVALAMVLIISAGLMLRSFRGLVAVHPGFAPEQLVHLSFRLPPSRYPQEFAQFPTWPEIHRFYARILANARALPGVQGAALAVAHPLDPGFTNGFVVVGREAESQPEMATRPVTPGYFRTAGVPLLRGRDFGDADDTLAAPVVIINDAAARRFFPGQDPVGQSIRFWGQARVIVGVVGNEKLHGLAAADPPVMYPPMAQAPMRTLSLVARASGDPRPLLDDLRRAIWAADPALPLFGVETMAETLARSLARERFTTLLLLVFAGVALVLAAVGVHGLLSYTVAQRAREIGVRTALGASPGSVARLILGEGLSLGALGIGLGLAGAAAAGLLLRGLLFGVSAWDPLTWAAVALVMGVATTAACAAPAFRAARADPLRVLRSD